MSENDFDSLQKLMRQYHKEAQRCKLANAPLAGCLMLAAAMEAVLLSMAYCFKDEVLATETFRKIGEKDLRKWNLKDLVALARETKWLPSKLPIDKIARLSGIEPEEALKQGDVGYFAEAVREVRDLVHPGRNLRLWAGVEVTKEYLSLLKRRFRQSSMFSMSSLSS